MDLGSAAREWQTHGFVILPGFVPAAELKPALEELPAMYPTAEGFHDGTDERRDRFTVDEWAGIESFPFRSAELSLLAVSDRVVDLAETLLADRDPRISSAEAWAKYTGAADYDQPLHRDYLNQTLMVPADDPRFRQLEMFVYLVDVPEELGPPSMLSRTRTTGLPAKPNWYPREGGADAEGGWVETAGSPDLYDAEVRAVGPAGTVVAWASGTFHRGTALTLPRGARYTIHLVYRSACAQWGQRMSWVIPQPRAWVVPVRAAGDTTAAGALRLPAARSSVLDRGHPRRHGAAVPRAGYDPVAAGAARRSVTPART